MELTCPKCEHEFDDGHYDADKCPKCGNGLIYDEQCLEDYSDCWTIILWESNNYEY
jgi:rRNA maturation endonuclease Nob1